MICTHCGLHIKRGERGLLVDVRTGDWWCRANPSNGGDAAPHEEATEAIPYKAHFTALFRALAACEAPEGTQVDGVLEEFQSTYDEAIGDDDEGLRSERETRKGRGQIGWEG